MIRQRRKANDVQVVLAMEPLRRLTVADPGEAMAADTEVAATATPRDRVANPPGGRPPPGLSTCDSR